MRNSQATLFIILGIIILVIVISLIYFANSVRKDRMGMLTEQTQKIPSELQPLVNYLNSCVEQVAISGLFLLGKQGGTIYESQGGLEIDYDDSLEGKFFLPDNGKKIPYLIELPKKVESLFCSYDLPAYPLINQYYPYSEGLNGIDMSKGKVYKQENCFGALTFISKSAMTNALESYIKKHVQTDCDFSSFSNYNINSSQPSLTLDTKGRYTQLILYYPLTITNKNTLAKTNLNEFTATIKFSLNELADFIDTNVNQNEVDDPTYDITKINDDYDFRVEVLPDKYNKDDIIRVSADSLLLEGQQFEFVYGRMNRQPILEGIYNVSFENIPLTDSSEGYSIRWQDVIHQPLEAVDPDEEKPEIKVIIGSNRMTPCVLTNESICKIEVQDINFGYLTARIEATDGQYTDYWEYNITKT